MNLRNVKSSKDRRNKLEKELKVNLTNIGSYSLNESIASTRNCENMIGVTQVPLGIAGPLRLRQIISNKQRADYYIPLATTEGALVASVNRGCKAIFQSGGAVVNSHRIGVTRGPVFYTGSIIQGDKFYRFLKSHQKELAEISESTSNHLKYLKSKVNTLGKYSFVRFYFDTQDAMGMNMATIATQKLVEFIEQKTGVKCMSVAGNFDIDKKPAWLNFIEHRGFKVWAEVTIPAKVLRQTLKVSASQVYETWLAKCMLGSALSGSLGFNAHFANVAAAIFLATGQDLGHVGEGSMGITTTEVVKQQATSNKQQEDLYVSVYLPDLMVGTVGGGTGLATQKEALEILGIAGGNNGKNSQQLAQIIGAAVLAGEISLLASEAEGSLARAHEKLARGNREA